MCETGSLMRRLSCPMICWILETSGKAEGVVPVSVQRPENQESRWYKVLVQKPADSGPGKS